MPIKFSIIIPSYNEIDNIPFLLKKCKHVISVNNQIEFIIVNNGSTDGSKSILRSFESRSIKILDLPLNKGYGYGILQGLSAAKGEYIGWTHADLQTNVEDVLTAINLIQKNQMNIFIKGYRKNRPIFDNFFSWSMGIFESLLFKKKFKEINAQPTLFHRNFFKSWENAPFDFSLDLYAYYQAHKKKQAILRFPVTFQTRSNGASSWNHGIISRIRFIKRTIKYSLKLKKNANYST